MCDLPCAWHGSGVLEEPLGYGGGPCVCGRGTIFMLSLSAFNLRLGRRRNGLYLWAESRRPPSSSTAFFQPPCACVRCYAWCWLVTFFGFTHDKKVFNENNDDFMREKMLLSLVVFQEIIVIVYGDRPWNFHYTTQGIKKSYVLLFVLFYLPSLG